MVDRLFLERECEHGQLGMHAINLVDEPTRNCPGGSRREVVVDLEAAEAVLAVDLGARANREITKAIVDAALGLEER